MNSCMYDCTVMHHRLEPLKNRFVYNVFMFYIDLDEVESLHRKLRLFSWKRFNLFTLYDRDHLTLSGGTVKESIRAYLRSKGIDIGNGKIFLLTHLRTLGYVFNPVSFYFCFDEEGNPVCAIPEVGNTFKELKPYLLTKEMMRGEMFRQRMKKHFYVSPFIDLDTAFDFQVRIPGDKLHIQIDDFKGEHKFFLTSLVGKRQPLTDSSMIRSFFRIPLVTLKVIALIHYQAAKLYLRKLKHHKKTEYPELQKEIFAWNK
jgi:DUF1365 family protein